ncbi:MAG: DUF333 domain-containing protein [bacterium]
MKMFIVFLFALVIAGCGVSAKQNSTEISAQNTTGIANPASVKCVKDGYKLEIRTSPDGGQYGVCINEAGDECEEWAYFRGECSFPR